jgi:hypothetical protein
MSNLISWPETESEIYQPGTWVLYVFAGGLAAIGVVFLVFGGPPLPERWVWVARVISGSFLVVGCSAIAYGICQNRWPKVTRHAERNLLPGLPNEPVLEEGTMVHRRLKHELIETERGWEFRPAERIWRNDQRFLIGFGVPFLIVFSGILTYSFHSGMKNWLLACLTAIFVTLLCGGTALGIMGLILHSAFRRLAKLSIPKDSQDLELDVADPSVHHADNTIAGLNWSASKSRGRRQLAIPRDWIIAVQLCPWCYDQSDGGVQTVQGLLVLQSPRSKDYSRVPILLTSEFVSAAQIFRRLSDVLQVPYLFSADAAGWKAEVTRAKTRPPLKSGGSVS